MPAEFQVLSRTLRLLKKEFRETPIRVRLDGGFATAEVFDFLDDEGVEYAVSMGKNSKLEEYAAPLMEKMRWDSYYSGQTEKAYGECLALCFLISLMYFVAVITSGKLKLQRTKAFIRSQ